jgi:hypothetical protein
MQVPHFTSWSLHCRRLSASTYHNQPWTSTAGHGRQPINKVVAGEAGRNETAFALRHPGFDDQHVRRRLHLITVFTTASASFISLAQRMASLEN